MAPNEIKKVGKDRYHVADSSGRQYVKITFSMIGGKRRTTWAVKIRTGAYYACDIEGDIEKTVGYKDGVPVIQREMILSGDDVTKEQPAGLSFKYGELEVFGETT